MLQYLSTSRNLTRGCQFSAIITTSAVHACAFRLPNQYELLYRILQPPTQALVQV